MPRRQLNDPVAELSPKRARFVREYLVDLNASAAYRRAGYAATGNSAEVNAARLLRDAQVAAAVAAAQKATAAKLEIDAQRVLREAWHVLIADPRELVEHRVGCCRYCWGARHRYQRTDGELERDREEFEQLDEKARARAGGSFDQKGGAGFDATKAPNPRCPECFGEGRGRVVLHDTRKLTPAAASLYAGTKQTRDGVEVKMHSKLDALDRLCRHLGLFDRFPLGPAFSKRLDESKSLADQGRAVLAAAATGELPMSHASQLLAGLGTLAKLIDVDELVERVAALERIANEHG